MWVLFDLSNGDAISKRYLWWFLTKKRAEEFLAEHRAQDLRSKDLAMLAGPFKFNYAKAIWRQKY